MTFSVGERMRHARGKTMTDVEVSTLCHLVMNTASGHFDEHVMAESPFGARIAFGGITLAVVVGLAMQDTAEDAVAEVGLERVRFRTPVKVGDTIYAYTEVLAVDGDVVTFRHWGVNHRDEVVCEVDRIVRFSPEAAS